MNLDVMALSLTCLNYHGMAGWADIDQSEPRVWQLLDTVSNGLVKCWGHSGRNYKQFTQQEVTSTRHLHGRCTIVRMKNESDDVIQQLYLKLHCFKKILLTF